MLLASCFAKEDAKAAGAQEAWFVDGDFKVMDIANGPVSRVYATVIEPGRVTVGDRATLEP